MSYSAKSLLQKAKAIEAIEIAKREAELQAKKEQKKIENERKKLNQDYVKKIGIRCIERALGGEFNCIISPEELKKYKSQIQACGLQIEKIKLTAEELQDDFPAVYDELGIEDELNSILSEIEDLKEEIDSAEENSSLLNDDLSDYNDQLYDLLESAVDDEWHLTYIEKKITDEIFATTFSTSDTYSDDQELSQGISELLKVLIKYKTKGIHDPDADLSLESSATQFIQELINEIPTIVKALKNHDLNIRNAQNTIDDELESRESQIQILEESKDKLLAKIYTLDIIHWDYGKAISSENSFLNPTTLCWIMNNPLMNDLFKFIEKKILEKSKSCEIIFKSFEKRYVSGKYLCDGLYFDDFLVEISLEDLINIFECLGYSVILKSTARKSDEPSGIIQLHLLKISWPSL
jgi:archaellum component FlaC